MTVQEKFYKMEAYGPKKEPRFLYSKHNLHLKYGTESAFEIFGQPNADAEGVWLQPE